MPNVLKAANVAVDTSYVRKTFAAAQDEVWVSAEIAFESAALALWTTDGTGATTFSGDFIDLINIGSSILAFAYIDGAGPGPEWTGPGALGPPPVPVAGSYQLLEIHFLKNVVREVYIDGTLVATDTAGNSQVTSIHVGQNAEAPLDPDAATYIAHVKAGTTRGATDLFSDDFSTGDLSLWTGSTGEVTVISDPIASAQLGVCIAFDDDTLEPNPTWTRLDDPAGYRVVSDWSIRRGRSMELDKTQTGTATISITDINGLLDPTNPSSPFTGNIDPMKQGAIALFNPVAETWHTIFRGFSDWSYEIDASGAFTQGTIELTDAFDLLSALELTPGHHGDTTPIGSEGDIYFNETTGPTPGPFTRIHQLLTDAGWPLALRKILTGNIQLQGTIYARRDQMLSALFDTADAEFPGVANFYVDKIGRPTFHGRYARFEPTDPDYEIEFWKVGTAAYAAADATIAPLSGLGYRRSKDDIINAALMTPRLTVGEFTPTELGSMFVKDDTSIGKYGWRSISFSDLLVKSARAFVGEPFDITAVAEMEKLASYYVQNYKAPHTRVTKIEFRPLAKEHPNAGALWELMCRVEIGDVITLTTDHPGGGGFDEDYFVEGISYDAAPMKKDIPEVTLTLDVSPRTLYANNPFGPSAGVASGDPGPSGGGGGGGDPPPSGDAYLYEPFDGSSGGYWNESVEGVGGASPAGSLVYVAGCVNDAIELRVPAQSGSGGNLVSKWIDSNSSRSGYSGSGVAGMREETWYRALVRFPTGYQATRGNWNWWMIWHDDATTHAECNSFGNNGASCAMGVVSDGSVSVPDGPGTNPRLWARMLGGHTSSPVTYSKILPSNSLLINHCYDMVFHYIWDEPGGLFEWWLDGVLITSVTTPTLYRRANSSLSYNSFGLYNYHPTATFANAIDFDEVYMGPDAASIGFTP